MVLSPVRAPPCTRLFLPPVSDAGWRRRKRKASPRSSPLETCFPLVPPLPSPWISLRSTWRARISHFHRLRTKKIPRVERFNPSKPLDPPKFVALASSLKGFKAAPSFLMIAPCSFWIPIPVVRKLSCHSGGLMFWWRLVGVGEPCNFEMSVMHSPVVSKVALICNHQISVSKSHENPSSRVDEKMNDLKDGANVMKFIKKNLPGRWMSIPAPDSQASVSQLIS
ncbi:hypothetical protein OPV22_023477 [Ensete ventricosum]|uniref:Uncharacterized protein n=1 Tax=Ensete ventricosum TaxID=4639 RepID=A0AAV8PCU5_ENSVE|nr:hypothetical protein OPV22_023477 [Ensete ventricosum]